MPTQPQRMKVPLPNYKSKIERDIYIQQFNNVFLANEKTIDVLELQIFHITLKKQACNRYSQFGPNHFPNLPTLRIAFL